MGNFSNNAITDVGKMMLADVQAGAIFTPTRIVIGSGSMTGGATAQGMTDVITPVVSIAINKKKRTPDGKCIFGGVYSNAEVTEAFYFRELALYAKAVYLNEDGTVKSEGAETLYSYGNAGTTADYMPAYSTSTVVEKQIDLVTWVGNDAQVDLTVESGIYITQAEKGQAGGVVPFDAEKNADIAGGRVVNVGTPVNPTDAVNKGYADKMLLKSGDTMTGDLKIEKAIAAVKLKTVNGEANFFKNANAANDLGTTISDVTAAGVTDRLILSAARNNADKLRLVTSDGQSHYILHTGNKDLVKPADIGAVSKAGDTMTGDLEISKQSTPTLLLTEKAAGSGAHLQMSAHQLLIINRPVAGDISNYRTFYINNHKSNDDIAYALNLSDVRNGVEKYYTVLHTGNIAAFGLGAVPASVE